MYKTVRHGENSLQYTILPQEEGIHVKPKKLRKKGKTAAILTVTVILICGIIATAVLVPLLLTSDLVVLPAAFQKFSVSSLRRSHAGNHVVVMAKKPHGWNNPHHSPVHQIGSNRTYITTSTTSSITYSNNNNNYNNVPKTQMEVLNNQVISSSTTEPTRATTARTTITILPPKHDTIIMPGKNYKMTSDFESPKKAMVDENLQEYEQFKYTKIPIGRNYLDISTTTKSSKGSDQPGYGVIRLSNTEAPTTSSPWFQNRWSFADTVPYKGWPGGNATYNFMTIAVGCIIVLLCLVIIFIIWMQRRRKLRNGIIKNSTDTKGDDKDTLLKESTAGSEED